MSTKSEGAVGILRLKLPGGKLAMNHPKLGQSLAPGSISPKKFCDTVNEMESFKNLSGHNVTVHLEYFGKGDFAITSLRSSSVADRIKQSLSLSKGSTMPGRSIIGYLPTEVLEKIAKEILEESDFYLEKNEIINNTERGKEILAKLKNTVLGTAKSMGIMETKQ